MARRHGRTSRRQSAALWASASRLSQRRPVASLAAVRSARRLVTQTRTAASQQLPLAAVKPEKVRIVVDREQPRFDEASVLAVQFDQTNLNDVAPFERYPASLDPRYPRIWTGGRLDPLYPFRVASRSAKQPVKARCPRLKFLEMSEFSTERSAPGLHEDRAFESEILPGPAAHRVCLEGAQPPVSARASPACPHSPRRGRPPTPPRKLPSFLYLL